MKGRLFRLEDTQKNISVKGPQAEKVLSPDRKSKNDFYLVLMAILKLLQRCGKIRGSFF